MRKQKKIKKITKKKLRKAEKRLLNRQLKLWTLGVKARDNNKCVICGDTNMLNAHHIVPRQDKTLRLDVNNGISLCPSHHRFSFVISAHHNPFVFYCWLAEHKPEQFNYLKIKAKDLNRRLD